MEVKVIDLGLLTSSQANSLPDWVVSQLVHFGEVTAQVSPGFLVRHWPGGKEWSTLNVRDAFYASPLFPRLLNPDAVRTAIVVGVRNKDFAYVSKATAVHMPRSSSAETLQEGEVDISDDVFLLKREDAEPIAAARAPATKETTGEKKRAPAHRIKALLRLPAAPRF